MTTTEGVLSLILGSPITRTFWALNFLLAMVCAFREIVKSRSAQGSIAWILSLVLLPFPTALLYLIFGWKHYSGYTKMQAFSGRQSRSVRAEKLALVDDEANKRWPVLTRATQLPFLSGNEVDLLIDGAATFTSILEGIAKAQSYVLVQFYIVRDDALGHKLADALIERAAAGVTVRLLYDDVGSVFLSKAYTARMKAAGVHVSAFNQSHGFLRLYGPTRINYRNHRKITVVDGTDAWVGGHNAGLEYLGQDKRFGHWRDTHVHVRGPAALACALTFREDWQWATGEALSSITPAEFPTSGDESILVMPTGPADKFDVCGVTFTEIIAQARQRLWIVSPYFVPNLDTQTALYAAAMRGVDVRILLPARPDHIIVWFASNAYAAAMVEGGVSVYRYTNGFLHQKVILMDDAITGVGTVNFDNRSFSLNFELTLWFTHPRTISAVSEMLERDFEFARPTLLEHVRSEPFHMRFLGRAARLFSPIL